MPNHNWANISGQSVSDTPRNSPRVIFKFQVILFVDATTFLPLGYDEEGTGGAGTSHSVYKKLASTKLTKQDFDWKKPRS